MSKLLAALTRFEKRRRLEIVVVMAILCGVLIGRFVHWWNAPWVQRPTALLVMLALTIISAITHIIYGIAKAIKEHR